MALLANQTPTSSGAVVTRNAVSASDTFLNYGRTFLLVVNGSGGELTVTITTQQADVDGLVIPDKVVTVATGVEKVIGPLSPGIYNDVNGLVTVGFSATSDVTAALIQLAA